MAERREEKYLLDMAEYSVVAGRVRSVLQADKNGRDGCYSICSLYFDDPFDTALYEKEDGEAVHRKFRIRTYDGRADYIRLERKIKRGIVTEKSSALISHGELELIVSGEPVGEESPCFPLVSELRASACRPVVSVRYDREAYVFPSMGIRVTFDKNVDRLSGHISSLFGDVRDALPALERSAVIMEIKYSERCPSFIRRLCSTYCEQISISKYALARR